MSGDNVLTFGLERCESFLVATSRSHGRELGVNAEHEPESGAELRDGGVETFRPGVVNGRRPAIRW
jgi:hypothetical protein